jgi:hypothetical protein
MQERKRVVAGPDYEKYAGLELHEPKRVVHLLSQFHGAQLAIVAVAAVTIAISLRTEVSMVVHVFAIAAIFVLGLVHHFFPGRMTNASSVTEAAENPTKS